MPNDLKNDLDTKDSINNTFISNQLSKTNNIELLKALENGFKLINLSDDEINIIISGIQNNEIKKSYIKKVENMLNNNKKMTKINSRLYFISVPLYSILHSTSLPSHTILYS